MSASLFVAIGAGVAVLTGIGAGLGIGKATGSLSYEQAQERYYLLLESSDKSDVPKYLCKPINILLWDAQLN